MELTEHIFDLKQIFARKEGVVKQKCGTYFLFDEKK